MQKHRRFAAVEFCKDRHLRWIGRPGPAEVLHERWSVVMVDVDAKVCPPRARSLAEQRPGRQHCPDARGDDTTRKLSSRFNVHCSRPPKVNTIDRVNSKQPRVCSPLDTALNTPYHDGTTVVTFGPMPQQAARLATGRQTVHHSLRDFWVGRLGMDSANRRS